MGPGVALLLFGHVGLTVGLVYGLLRALAPPRARARVDYRLVMAGALLSDVIDKPVGIALGITGRAVAHTLLFASLLTLLLALPLVAPRLYPRRVAARLGNPAIYLVPGVWTHLLFDRMWELPATLLWPSRGLAFAPGAFDLVAILRHGLTDPYLLGGELGGLAVLALLGLRHGLHRPGALAAFLRSGRLAAGP